MHRISRLTIVFTTFIVLASGSAFADSTPSFAHLLVKGEAEAEVPPDKATISLRVVEFDPQAEAATQRVQDRLVELLKLLDTYSVPENAITSHSLSKNIERQRVDMNETNILGYLVTRKVEIELEDLARFSVLFTDIAKLDNVSSLNASFDVSDRGRHEAELMERAAANARQKAQTMLHGTDRTLGPVYSIAEDSFSSRLAEFQVSGDYAYANINGPDSSPYTTTIFKPATIQITQRLNVIFALE